MDPILFLAGSFVVLAIMVASVLWWLDDVESSLDQIKYQLRQIQRQLDEMAPIPVGEIVEEEADPDPFADPDWWKKGIK